MDRNRIVSFLADCRQLMKVRLSVVVVFSASMAYLWACNNHVDAKTIWLLSIGGFLLTAASNTLNQILERNSDALMKRTAQRPLPTGRMNARQAFLLALIWGGLGTLFLLKINMLCGVLGLSSLLVYALVYTPMKKISSFAVFPGALAGSLPVVIGVAAATGALTSAGITLFIFQFIWQFPHTWTIAWLQNDEYNRAGLKMLPSSRHGELPAFLILLSTFLIIPASLLLYMYEFAGVHVIWILVLAGVALLGLSVAHYRRRSRRSALALMLSCLVYLPASLVLLVIEKFL